MTQRMRTRLLALVGSLAAIVALTGCATSTAEAEPATPPPTNSAWPLSFTNADGSTTQIPAQPRRIVSTSVTVTGTLLAIDAPVVASGSAANGKFFAQWSAVADERTVANLWPAGSVKLEALYGQNPDLIVVASTGADSVVDQLPELRNVAPTIVVDYGQTWQELATELGTATGLESNAQKTVSEFSTLVSDAKGKITVPAGQANIVSFNGPGQSNPIARAGSAQAEILHSLGFTIEDPPVAWHTQAQPRADFVFAAYENLSQLTAQTTFVLSVDNAKARSGFGADPVLANVPSVKDGQVYGLGVNSFRVDKYSATEIVNGVVENFS